MQRYNLDLCGLVCGGVLSVCVCVCVCAYIRRGRCLYSACTYECVVTVNTHIRVQMLVYAIYARRHT